MTTQFKIILLALAFIPLTSGATTIEPSEGQEFVKEINKSFPLRADGRVELANKYGQINVRPWNKNQVQIDVRIVVQARDQKTADQVFERIGVDFYDTDNLVKAQTAIGSKGSKWWDSLWGGSNNRTEFRIYYEVQMPATAYLKAEARYCDVRSGDLSGDSEFDIKYGDLVAGNLGGETRVQISYGSGNVDKIANTADVYLRYSKLDVDEAADVEVESRYSEVMIDRARDLELDCRYDDIEIGVARNVEIDAGYGEVEIEAVETIRANSNYTGYEVGKVRKKVDMDTDYGDIEVGPVAAGFEEIRIRGGYSDIEVELEEDAGYQISARASYADIDYPSDLNLSVKENKSSSETIKGTKSGQGNGIIDISSSYGDIDIRQ